MPRREVRLGNPTEVFWNPELEHSEPNRFISCQHGLHIHPWDIFSKEGAGGSMARVQLVESLTSQRRIGVQRRNLKKFAEGHGLSVMRQ
jgi:hypothetical protein